MLRFLLVDNWRVFITQSAKQSPNQCSFKSAGFLTETQTCPGIPRVKLSVASWSSPARTRFTALCPPSLCQERLALFLNSSCLLSECHLLMAFLEIVTLPSQVPANFLPKAPTTRYTTRRNSFLSFPLLWFNVCFPLETWSPLGRGLRIPGREEVPGRLTGAQSQKRTQIRRVC